MSEEQAWPDLSGRLTADGSHVLPVRIYYEDTDAIGIVYHSNYLRFMERGRSDFLKLRGVGHIGLTSDDGDRLAFVVRHMDIEFQGSARLDDVITVVTRVLELTAVRLILVQEARRRAEVLTTARVTIVLVDRAGRPRRIPQVLKRALTDPIV
ncbi:MAG: YbgC/FadM family acyl-CoA thioesterase [Pseudomonadota bacterium]